MPSETIAIACDHGGYELKLLLRDTLEEKGYQVLDLGTDGPDSVDYPDYGFELAEIIRDG